MKKHKTTGFILAAILLLSVVQPITADNPPSESVLDYTPYEQEEFAQWMHDLRRGEILFFGTLPLTYGIVSLGFSIVGDSTGPLGTDDYAQRIGAAAVLSFSLALADYIIGLVKNSE